MQHIIANSYNQTYQEGSVGMSSNKTISQSLYKFIFCMWLHHQLMYFLSSKLVSIMWHMISLFYNVYYYMYTCATLYNVLCAHVFILDSTHTHTHTCRQLFPQTPTKLHKISWQQNRHWTEVHTHKMFIHWVFPSRSKKLANCRSFSFPCPGWEHQVLK